MNLEHLRAFCAVAELGSFTQAAERLHLTQPAVSQQVKALETELGARLLIRTAREVRLTDEGGLAFRYGRVMLSLDARARGRIQRLAQARAAELRMGVSLSVGEHLLPRILGPINARHPSLAIELLVASSSSVAQRVADGDVDIGIVEGEVTAARLVARHLLENELILIVAPSHALARTGRVSPADLGALPLIVREPGSGSRECLDAAFGAAGIGAPRVYLVLASNQAVKAAVESGLGAAFLSRITVLPELERGTVIQLATPGVTVPRPVLLVHRKGEAPAGQFVDELLQILAAL